MTVAFAPSLLPSMASTAERRILALHFPELPTDRIARAKWGRSWRSTGRPEHPPILCMARNGNAVRITALDKEARLFGLRIGQGVAEARAICPDVEAVEAEPMADRQLLDALADWCDRYTPLVAIDGVDGLMLDITGCAHLFGGEAAMLDDILQKLFLLGFLANGVISSTPGLSWGLVRFGGRRVVRMDEMEEALLPLPVAGLRLEAGLVDMLAKLGLVQAGDLMAMPRAPLARRFGAQVLLRLDQALGLSAEPISPRKPVAMLSVERNLAEPIRDHDMILDLVKGLAGGLKPGLEARGEGGRAFELLLFRVDGKVQRVDVATAAPLRDPMRIGGLFSERLGVLKDDLDAGFGFELVRLNLLASEVFQERDRHLAKGEPIDDGLPAFFDRVAARLGADCLSLPVTRASHWPERASSFLRIEDGDGRSQVLRDDGPPPARGERPLRLLVRPEMVEVTADVPHGPPARFRWRRVDHRVRRAEGPERLSPEWWIEPGTALERDYFRIEDAEGRRFWLYREGLYERGDKPSWFMQGVFA